MSELYCTLCERLLDISDMRLARDFRGNGKASRATYLSKDGLAHVFLNSVASARYKPKPEQVIVQVIGKPVEEIEGEDNVNQNRA